MKPSTWLQGGSQNQTKWHKIALNSSWLSNFVPHWTYMDNIWAYMRLYDQISWDLANFCVELMAGLLVFFWVLGRPEYSPLSAPLKKKRAANTDPG